VIDKISFQHIFNSNKDKPEISIFRPNHDETPVLGDEMPFWGDEMGFSYFKGEEK
jgi:hypothetical protein